MATSSVAYLQLGCNALVGGVWTSVDTQTCCWLKTERKVIGFPVGETYL